eukprot:Tbor_TRINITY_DN5958_c0_g1::TRINITY_DN5958_c0_g1_i2::g.19154::m.19154
MRLKYTTSRRKTCSLKTKHEKAALTMVEKIWRRTLRATTRDLSTTLYLESDILPIRVSILIANASQFEKNQNKGVLPKKRPEATSLSHQSKCLTKEQQNVHLTRI